MLIGEYEHSLDPKGRVIFPVKLRESLGEEFVVTKGLQNCLFVYGKEEWEGLTQKINALPMPEIRHTPRKIHTLAVPIR